MKAFPIKVLPAVLPLLLGPLLIQLPFKQFFKEFFKQWPAALVPQRHKVDFFFLFHVLITVFTKEFIKEFVKEFVKEFKEFFKELLAFHAFLLFIHFIALNGLGSLTDLPKKRLGATRAFSPSGPPLQKMLQTALGA